jgi:hypothetical protein
MKMNVFIPALYPYRWKYLGLFLLSALFLCLIAIRYSLVNIPLDIQWIKWGILVSLTILAYSKEKTEDERIRNIRFIAQHYAFQFLISLVIAYYLVNFIFSLSPALTALDLILMGLVLNTCFFYTAKWFGKKDINLSFKSLPEIIREDKLLILIWSILTLITVLTILVM